MELNYIESLPKEEQKKYSIEGKGFCQIWGFFVLELVLLNPDMKIQDIYKIVYEELENKPEYFRNVIRGFFIDTNEELLKINDKLSLSKISTKEDFQRINQYFDESIEKLSNKNNLKGSGPGSSGIRHINRGMKGQLLPLAVKVADNIIENRSNPLGMVDALINTAQGGGSKKDYALHAVIIDKKIPFEEAFIKAKEIIKKNKFFHRETKNKYRFRNIPKGKFIGKSFKSKKVNKDITLVFGELKPENIKLAGSGLFDFFKSGFEKVKELGKKVLSSDIGQKIVNKGINIISQKIDNKQEMPENKYMNSERVPEISILHKMAIQTYEKTPNNNIDGWELVSYTPTLKFYKKGDVISVAIRGTEKEGSDFIADIGLTLGNLTKTSRFINDLQILKEFQNKYSPLNYYYIGVAHSLGGAILDNFINLGLIKEGVSFNPAIDKNDLLKDTKNRRIYLSNDPLLNLFGKYSKWYEVIPTKLSPLDAHSINNSFGSGKPKYIKMKTDDYLEEHKDLIKLLDSISNKASKESIKQQNEPDFKKLLKKYKKKN